MRIGLSFGDAGHSADVCNITSARGVMCHLLAWSPELAPAFLLVTMQMLVTFRAALWAEALEGCVAWKCHWADVRASTSERPTNSPSDGRTLCPSPGLPPRLLEMQLRLPTATFSKGRLSSENAGRAAKGSHCPEGLEQAQGAAGWRVWRHTVPSQISWAKKKATASFSLRLRGREGKQNELGKDLKPRSPVVGPQEEPDMTSEAERDAGKLVG
jgi:hypothetical protein